VTLLTLVTLMTLAFPRNEVVRSASPPPNLAGMEHRSFVRSLGLTSLQSLHSSHLCHKNFKVRRTRNLSDTLLLYFAKRDSAGP